VAQLAERLARVERTSVNAAVDCSAGQRIGDVIAQAGSFRIVAVFVSGVCTESLHIADRAHVILRGATPDAEIAAPPGTPYAIRVGTASHVSLGELTLRGSSTGELALSVVGGRLNVNNASIIGGVALSRGSAAEVFGSRIEDPGASASSAGLLVDGQSSVFAFGLTIRGFGVGVHARQSAVVLGTGTEVSGQTSAGILLAEGSSASLFGTIAGGPGVGVEVRDRSTAILQATVEGHDGPGVVVRGASHVRFAQEAIVRRNGESGVRLSDTSVLEADASDLLRLQIHANGGWGIECAVPPQAPQAVGTALGPETVFDNQLGQVSCPGFE
jgi:hypothetical protein